jgi:phage terminase large subunit GpA-like protein
MTRNLKLEFCESYIRLHGQRIRFDGRHYLPAVYASQARNLVIRGSRQIEKSTFISNTILFESFNRPGISILLVCPRWDQARVFVRTRLLPVLQNSPLVRRMLLGKTMRQPQLTNLQFANGSQLHVRAAYHSADAVRGISADLLLVDEVQDVAAGDLPVLRETLSHSTLGRTILTGTPN